MPPYLPKIIGIANAQIYDLTENSSKAYTENPTLGQLTLLETNLDNDGTKIGNVALPGKHNLTDLLHSMFRHIGNKLLKQLVWKCFGNEASKGITRKLTACQQCYIAKSTRNSVLAICNRTKEPMEIVMANLMGKLKDMLPYGGKYALTKHNIGSTYSECHILTKKSDATLVLLRVMTIWETKTGKKIKMFCSDTGGEFCNSILENWSHLQGTIHEKILPYHHEQNGSIE
ncbi:hypothetical protein O181_003364 [Austropuccinia psidii MF-1]|uniref:Integrase catalytic domain-containing protein n=1 Tax=Austropuccinia psidii MF-1 TaxID=1389203 RepID=A0A9Q3BDZ4_9BASI|nr:hypothetical protein [Austropuccinia psidii MF-1]